MPEHAPLSAQALYTPCPVDHLPFETTDELGDGDGLFGQARALDAISFGVEMKQPGHNLFVTGPSGTGRRSFVERYLADAALAEAAPDDWCYVNDFDNPEHPRALRLPAGAGPRFASHVADFVREVQAAVGAAFASEEYRTRRQLIEREFQEQQGEAFEKVQQAARERNIRIMQTPGGMIFAPLENGEVVGPDEFEKLPAERQKAIQAAVEEIGKLFQESMRDMPDRLRASRERVRELDRQVAEFAIQRLVADLQRSWHAVSEAAAWLEALHADLAGHYEILREPGAEEQAQAQGFPMPLDSDEAGQSRAERRYAVNVLVTHEAHGGAPVVVEERPAYGRLVGKIEHRARFGALLTDFRLIRAGALHQANGGYLVMQAERLLSEPFAWESLKEALRTQTVRIVPLDQIYGAISTTSLEPAPIPLELKVVLIGSPRLYYLLSSLDPEFEDYFKVVAEFDDRAERSAEVALRFAHLVADATRRDGLPPLERDAVARLIEEAARDAEDAEKVSTEIRRSMDIMREACHWARKRRDECVRRADVERAIELKTYRKGRLRERLLEEIHRDTLVIDTDGARIGQINALSVLALQDQAFGRPNRITARVALGSGRVVDIEREAELGGALHSKGILILAGYINARFAANLPASFAATLTFEQSYGGVDGDSASSTELYALVSALAEVPIKQCFAVTGSVNQFGEVQAIGGVNHKIEGFFDVCERRGLTGEQGVLIPRANVKHLMLRERVVAAVRAGRFHIHAVGHVDQGLEILTGLPAGEADEDGEFPPGSVNRRVQERLARFADRRREFAREGNGNGKGDGVGGDDG